MDLFLGDQLLVIEALLSYHYIFAYFCTRGILFCEENPMNCLRVARICLVIGSAFVVTQQSSA